MSAQANIPLKDVIGEADRILTQAERKKVTLRLVGGVAIGTICPSASSEPSLRRIYADVDLIGHKNQKRQIKLLFQELGYDSRSRFNVMQGDERLVFNDLENMRRVDIFLDIFRMCHAFNLKNRLELNERTLTLADLVATKLQVIQATEREYKDIMCLFLDHEIADRDEPENINGKYLARLAAADWGIYTTFKKTLTRVTEYLKQFPLPDHKKTIIMTRIGELQTRLDQEPKSLSWRMRSTIGERAPWYDLPDADKKLIK
ncbi:MAG: hypothetical protein ACLPY5_14565 [Candidatus Bathyarchaeia archaeon]